MVLAPMDPVAPRIVTLRGTALATGTVRARGTDSTIASPNQQSARGSIEAAAHQAQQRCDRRRGHEPIEPIHEAAVTRNEFAGILGPETALERRFQQISDLGG